jgi:hypothetical protein
MARDKQGALENSRVFANSSMDESLGTFWEYLDCCAVVLVTEGMIEGRRRSEIELSNRQEVGAPISDSI